MITERFRFHKRDQKGETVAQYVAQIRKLSEYCEFGDNLGDSLRDKLVCGLRNEQTQKLLLSKRNLTFDCAVDISVAVETATNDAAELGQYRDAAAIHKVQPKQNRRQYRKPCFSIAWNGHTPDEFRFRDAQCHKCKQKGHVKPACHSNGGLYEKQRYQGGHSSRASTGGEHTGSQRTPVHIIEDMYDSDENVAALEIHSMNRSTDTNIIWVSPKVNGTPLRMELDTGSVVSVINKQQFDEYLPEMKTRYTSVILKTYCGEDIFPLGIADVDVEYNGQQQKVTLFVVKNGGPALFGRQWLSKIRLDWKSIKHIAATQGDCRNNGGNEVGV